MTKVFSIFFSGLILIQSLNINLEDISKLNILLEHASFHQESYGDNFFEFLVEHYSDNTFKQGEDHEEHNDLPFKHDHQTCHHVNSSFTISQVNFDINNKLINEVLFDFYYQESLSFFEKPSVFQPPQLM